jgi:hypothetical protein
MMDTTLHQIIVCVKRKLTDRNHQDLNSISEKLSLILLQLAFGDRTSISPDTIQRLAAQEGIHLDRVDLDWRPDRKTFYVKVDISLRGGHYSCGFGVASQNQSMP